MILSSGFPSIMKRFLLSFFALATAGSAFAQIYQESDGLVVLEAEDTSSELGLWEVENSLDTFSGTGYLRFLGNNFQFGPPASPLEYQFTINRPGLYYLHLHCAKETIEERTDVANDVFVRVEGDYTSGPGPHDSHGDNASLSLLSNDTKYFGGAKDAWKWENGQNSSGGSGNLDPGGHNNKRVAVYDFKAGETYRLVMSGRSKFFRVNRIVFRHIDTSILAAQNLNTPPSETSSEEVTLLYDALDDFTNIEAGEVPYYRDNGNDVLAIAANVVANRIGFARASRSFDGPTGSYNVTITTLTEEDGESDYRLLVNGVEVRSYTNPFVYAPPESPLDLQPNTHTWRGVQIPAGATIAIESNAVTNGEIPEGDGTAYARGRWRQIEFSTNSSLVRPPAGRIAIVADGNSPDPDDIGATAVMLGLFKGASLSDRLVHLSHSCDLDPFSNRGNQRIDASNELRRQNKLEEVCEEGIGFFGPFSNLTDFYNCRTAVVGQFNVQAVNNLRDAINVSTAADPLWIIEAGEPDVIGYALQAADEDRRQFVNVVSHHPANDNSGDFFTWQQILDFGVIEHQIGDQNVGLQVLRNSGLWDWAENHPTAGFAWIWEQLDYAEQDGVVSFQDGKLDCSDAGMLYWWLTGGPDGGNNISTPVEVRSLLLEGCVDAEGPVAYWPLDEGEGNTAGNVIGEGNDGTLLNGASWGSDDTRESYVAFDGTDDRITTPFTYALSSEDDFTWAWWANQISTGDTDLGAIMVGNRYPQPGAGGDAFEFIKLSPGRAQFSTTSVIAEIENYNYASIAQGSWHHYAMVKSGTSFQWYVDGVAQGQPVTINYNETAPIPFFIGGDDNGTGRVNEHFEGCIDDVVLYRRALEASEVANIADGGPLVSVVNGPDVEAEPEQQSGVLAGLVNDADPRDDGIVVNLSGETLVPGKSGGNGGFDRSTVFVFRLPDLGAVESPFLTASLGFNVEDVSANPPSVDLYGLGARPSPDVLASDYYGATPALDASDATLIEGGILTGSSGAGLMSSSASANLAAYLNEQYNGGAGIGDYVFLRFSTTENLAGLQRHFLTSADTTGDNGPRLDYATRSASDYEIWRGQQNFAPGVDLAAGGDPDGDGLNNWTEYLFGLDPLDSSAVSPFRLNLEKESGTFSYTRRNPSLSGVSDYQIWTSEELIDWTRDFTATEDLTASVNDVQEVLVTLSDLGPKPDKLFVRVIVE